MMLLVVSGATPLEQWYSPQVHQDPFQLLTSGTEVFEVDNNLCDLRKVAHALKLFRDLLADVVGK